MFSCKIRHVKEVKLEGLAFPVSGLSLQVKVLRQIMCNQSMAYTLLKICHLPPQLKLLDLYHNDADYNSFNLGRRVQDLKQF